jgi:hypothetical protein
MPEDNQAGFKLLLVGDKGHRDALRDYAVIGQNLYRLAALGRGNP